MGSKAILVIDPHPFWREVKPRLEKTLQLELVHEDAAVCLEEVMASKFFAMAFISESLADRALGAIKLKFPLLPVLVVTSRPSVQGAVAAMREGAQDYLALPLAFEKLREVIQPALIGGDNHCSSCKNKTADNGRVRPVITRNPAMLHILRLAEAVAPTRATVLIQGESGTGKEILARYIHSKSDRAAGPFVAVNCAALPEGLLESELFGHEKGAFTGAIMRKLGKFELAQNGTLLLDEISEMHPHLQAKLLRVLQENEIDRVGGRHAIPINVRVMATTNQNLPEVIQKGGFREDLYYRLQVISFELPPLRARRDDIPLLARHFLQHFCRLFEKGALNFTAAALSALETAPWPGNVRQLENAVARGVLLAQSPNLHPRDLFGALPPEAATALTPALPNGKPVTLREMEQQMIFTTLNETSGNRTHAARLLGISVRTLRNKLHEYRQEALAQTCRRSQVA
ncbi:MAG: sigma-54 dependent transcriptional regulator [Deltaproteobacteria bacterium]|nr:sigma-54 dependent transcriptional regulator [Deltaproteobacteria bacterium]